MEIVEVKVWGETYKALWDRAYFGTEVWIGDQLCGTIGKETMTEKFSGTNGFGS